MTKASRLGGLGRVARSVAAMFLFLVFPASAQTEGELYRVIMCFPATMGLETRCSTEGYVLATPQKAV